MELQEYMAALIDIKTLDDFLAQARSTKWRTKNEGQWDEYRLWSQAAERAETQRANKLQQLWA